MRRPVVLTLVTAGFLTAAPAIASVSGGKTVPMPFDDCEAIIAEIASDVGVEPVVMATDAGERKVGIDAADGFVSVSCDRAEATMSLSKTPHKVTASR